jgi:hypothetical protein
MGSCNYYGGLVWIYPAQDRGKWQSFVKAVMNIWVTKHVGKFLSKCETIGLPGRVLLYGVSYRLDANWGFSFFSAPDYTLYAPRMKLVSRHLGLEVKKSTNSMHQNPCRKYDSHLSGPEIQHISRNLMFIAVSTRTRLKVFHLRGVPHLYAFCFKSLFVTVMTELPIPITPSL